MIWKRLGALLRALARRLSGRPDPRAGDGRDRRRRQRRKRPDTALGTFGTRIGRHAGIYGGGQGAALLLGLITLAVLTRFLPPAEFGQFALYYFFAALLTMLYTLVWLRGGMLWVYGAGGGDDDDDDDEDASGEGPTPRTLADDKRRALGTALALVTLVGALGTAAVALAAGMLAELLGGDRSEAGTALLAGVAGALSGVWRLAAHVPRRERRPKTYVCLNLLRPLLVLVVTVPLVAAEASVERAVLGLAIGSAGAAAVSIAAIAGSVLPALGAVDVRGIAGLGVRYVPLVLSLWLVASGGVFLLAAYASPSEVGYFRVATGIAAVSSLPIAAFLMAWGPLRKEPIYRAVAAERGKAAASGVLASYFALAALWVLLALAVGAELLVRVAPPAYAEAAPLIPILGLALLLQGWFRVMRRTGSFPNRRAWYVGLAVAAAVTFVGAGLVLVPALGATGAALAVVAAFLCAAGGMTIRSQAGRTPVPLAYGRILVGIAFAAGCFALARFGGEAAGALAPLVEAAALAAYPLLLIVSGTVPRAHLAPLGKVAAAAVPGRAPERDNGHIELGALDPVERAVLELLVRHRRPLDDVAPLVGSSPDRLSSSFVAALRHLGGVGGPSPADGGLGSYLLSADPVAARDELWRRLDAAGADPLEVDALLLTLERLRRAPARAWRR